MNYIQGVNRDQIQMMSMEDWISEDNPVRVIDALVRSLNLKQLGFINNNLNKDGSTSSPEKGGRPSYAAADMLKIYLYGYYNRIRSSRMLARECIRNIELRWLVNALTPNYHTIADFRKDYRKELKGVFKSFTSFLLNNDLLNGENVAIDGTKFRAVNAKKNNYNADKISRHLQYIENKTEEYLKQCEELDGHQNASEELNGKLEKLQSKLISLKDRKLFYEELSRKINAGSDGQISTVDQESRSMPIHHNQIEVAYNIQCATDDKHCLIIHYQATNENDTKALYEAAQGAKNALQKKAEEAITVLADKGYHTGEQLHQCEVANINTLVANPERTSAGEVPTPEYMVAQFKYDKERNNYTCPQGQTLTTNGSWYTKDHTAKTRKKSTLYKFQQFKTKACTTCVAKQFCSRNIKGRIIDRSEYQDSVDRNNARIINEKERYLLRQQIVEHPFGTIKRAWGYYHTLLKGKEKVNAELAIIFTVYNLRRVVSLLGVKDLIKRLKRFKKSFLKYFYTTTLHKLYYKIYFDFYFFVTVIRIRCNSF